MTSAVMPPTMPRAPRIGILGANTLLGKELGELLRDRPLAGPAAKPQSPRLLEFPPESESSAPAGKPAGATHTLLAFEDEPALVDPLDRTSLADLDLLFLAASPADSRRAWELARHFPVLVVDLTGALTASPAVSPAEAPATLAGALGLAPASTPTRLLAVAHPGADALVQILARLDAAFPLTLASATVFEPASERGLAGVRELEQQTVRMLSLQAQPQQIYDAQVAFNLRASLGPAAEPSLAHIRGRIAAETRALLARCAPDCPLPAVELLQAPLFHASVISLYLRFKDPVGPDALSTALAASGPAPAIALGDPYPDAVAAAAEDRIQLGPFRSESDPPGGIWCFATLDNLRRTALCAVESVRQLLS